MMKCDSWSQNVRDIAESTDMLEEWLGNEPIDIKLAKE